MDRSVLYNISYGVYAVGVMDEETPTGCIINTACQITSENPILSISMSRNNYTYEALKKAGAFTLSILCEDAEDVVIGTLGYRSGRDVKKFDIVPYELFHDMPVLTQSCGVMALDIIKSVDMETHVVFFARLVDTKAGTKSNPMTYAYYHNVKRRSAPKNAPTFQAAEAKPEE